MSVSDHRPGRVSLWGVVVMGSTVGAGVTFWILIMTVLLLSNGFDLDSIARTASFGFLACYLGIFAVTWKRRQECGANAGLLWCGGRLMSL